MPFPHLFTPLKVGNLTLKNRIYSSGHIQAYSPGGLPGDQMVAYHEEKAKGGLALTIMSGSTSVSPSSPVTTFYVAANHDERIIPAYRAVAEAVHAHDAFIFDQITHLGRRGHSEGELALVAPSDVVEPANREVPHVLEEPEILQIIRDFGQAALRCKTAGLDGVEISAAHNHLIDQFWAADTNRRTDRWGGSLDNRMRFAFAVIEEVRNQVGTDFVVGIRLTADEMRAGGPDAADMAAIAGRLAKLGMLDFFSVIGGSAETWVNLAAVVPGMLFPAQLHLDLVAAIKDAVDVPVFHAQRILTPEQAERILAEGRVDMVGMTRAIIADPHMPNKAQAGHVEDIRPCVGANYCLNRVQQGKTMLCIHNPVTGRERALADLRPSTVQKRVLVVGGGPAGLEAARVAAERGHAVVLFERSNRLGGDVVTWAKAPKREPMLGISRWLERQVRKLGVDVRLNTEATPEAVLAENPDTVVVATGGHPYRDPVPGYDAPNVVDAIDVLEGRADVGERVLVVDNDGGHTGPAVADLLAGEGKQVEIVTRLRYVGEDIQVDTLPKLYERLFGAGVTMTPHVHVTSVRESTVTLRNVYADREETREVDTVVLALGTRATDDVYQALKDRVPEIHLVGDAMAPRGLHTAMYDATKIGRAI